eukprot:5198816-Pyramimonas_sp.AAC.1
MRFIWLPTYVILRSLSGKKGKPLLPPECEICALYTVQVRLAWHDSGNYDVNTKTGGANGSIRFEKELAHNGNAGIP